MKVKLVIFDVDGTVYDQKWLRFRMLAELLWYLATPPFRISKVRMLSKYRKLIESAREGNSTGYHDRILKQLSEKYQISTEELSIFIDEWMQKRPLKYLVNSCHKEIPDALSYLESQGIPWTFYSDYYPNDKLDALGIKYSSTYYSAMDKINCLKPDRRSMDIILNDYNVTNSESVIVGDRIEVDGQLAINSGTHFILFKASEARGTLAGSLKTLIESGDDPANGLQFITG
jgi:FMN phosphatase YigB (HAD superfamily)